LKASALAGLSGHACDARQLAAGLGEQIGRAEGVVYVGAGIGIQQDWNLAAHGAHLIRAGNTHGESTQSPGGNKARFNLPRRSGWLTL